MAKVISKLVTIRLSVDMLEEIDELCEGMASDSHLTMTRASVMRSALNKGICSLKRALKRRDSLLGGSGGSPLFLAQESESDEPAHDPQTPVGTT